MSKRYYLLSTVFLIIACHDSATDREARREKGQEEHVESTRAQLLGRYPNVRRFDTREAGSIYRGLTIDAQDAIAAAPEQAYWNDATQLDIYRDSGGSHLKFRAIGDHWVSLDCADSQVSQLRKFHRTDRIFAQFTFVFTLTSAAPLRVELRGTNNGGRDDESLSVVADDIDGRLYGGRLVDFVLLDEGEPIETP